MTALGGTKRGFTLIELLVVVGILALLAAILFPVLVAARGRARTTACTSNLRQLHLSSCRIKAKTSRRASRPMSKRLTFGSVPAIGSPAKTLRWVAAISTIASPAITTSPESFTGKAFPIPCV